MLKRLVIYIAIILLGCTLGANIYNSVVDAPNWGAGIPASLAAAKQYFTVANPGNYFRVVSPAAQVAALLALIVGWRAGGWFRGLGAAALVLAVLGDVLTFAYFYPRNEIMFGPEVRPGEVLQNAWSGWTSMNHVRSAAIAAAMLCEMAALSVFERRAAVNAGTDKNLNSRTGPAL